MRGSTFLSPGGLYSLHDMRIVLVNWAMVWDGAVSGGGVNGYCQSLAMELQEQGHDVVYLSGGLTFVPLQIGGSIASCHGLAPPPPEIRRHPDWLGIRVFEVINSPVVAPSIHQFSDPGGEIAAPQLESLLGEFFSLLQPDIVHFHNIEGFTAGCVAAARVPLEAGGRSRVFYSLHNYHTVCPQVYLMQGHRTPCVSFRNGHACEKCIDVTPPQEEIGRRMASFAAAHPAVSEPPSPPPEAPQSAPNSPEDRSPVLRQIGKELRSMLLGPRPDPTVPDAPPPVVEAPRPLAPVAPLAMPGSAVASRDDVWRPLAQSGTDVRGQTPHLLAERNQPRRRGPGDPEWEPLDNEPSGEPTSSEAPNAFAHRRAAMVRMLNGCDRVLAVSEFVRRKFESLGVEPGVIRTNHIGTRLNRVAAMHKDVIFDPPPFDRDNPRPVRLVFMGFNNWYKGLHMFADSLELLQADQLRRLHLYIYGIGVGADEWRFRRMEPRLGGLTVHPMYAYYDVPWILGGKDLGIVPSVWWDNAPQTVFEFMACGVPVLGANLGGIPDFVRDGHNGLLFRGNDRYDLARRLGEVAREPWKLSDLRRNVRPPKDIADHARELVGFYGEGALSHEPKLPSVVAVAPGSQIPTSR